jgi:alpha-tubulin suppressor-like RCC1 family protein
MQVDAGCAYTVGLKVDGGVIITTDIEPCSSGLANVSDWTDIVQIAAGESDIVGVKSNGTVVAVGHPTYGELSVGSWSDIIQVDIARYHTVGLKVDGTVVAVGSSSYGECNVSSW